MNDAVINNAYNILKIREKSVRNILKYNQEYIISLISYLEYFNDSQSESSAEISVLKHYNTCFEILNEDNKYYSYINKADFTVTVWFYIRKLSKNDIINFFKQCAFDQWYSTLSFINSLKWLNSLHQILYKIWDNKWNIIKIIIL